MAQWLIGLSCGLSGQRWPSSNLHPYKYQRMAGVKIVVRGAIKDYTGRFRDDYRLGRTRYVDFINNYGSIDSTGHIPWTASLHHMWDGRCHGFRVLPYYQGFRDANCKLIRTHPTSHAQWRPLGRGWDKVLPQVFHWLPVGSLMFVAILCWHGKNEHAARTPMYHYNANLLIAACV